jgi:hypothetical protein
MPSRPRTLRTDLDSLPQFEPDHTLRLEETQHESALPFPENRARQIGDILSAAMEDHVREARFQGEPTSLKRFIANAMRAIATYESRCLRNRLYDRKRASKLLNEVRDALWALQQTLEPIVEWKQLDRYLESLFVADRKQHDRQHVLKQQQEQQRILKRLQVLQHNLTEKEQHQHHIADSASQQPAATREENAAGELVRQLERGDRYRSQFRSKSPKVILKQIEPLGPLMTLALDKLKLQAGDFQRDEIVREFADAMVFAWMSATGAVPTISKSKKPLPFQRLLATINREILRPEIRHKTDFRSPAVVAAGRARSRMRGKTPRP